MAPGFPLLLAAQFLSALADNALLIATIGWLQWQHAPAWAAPLLRFAFTLSFVAFAPWMGRLADRWPKARWLAALQGVKLLGVLALLAGAPPLLAFAAVGFGAAAYAPAKFGWLHQHVPPERLVAANGWIEASVVLAAVLGTVLGGVLTRPALLLPHDGGPSLSFALLAACHALAGGLHLAMRAGPAVRSTAAPASTGFRHTVALLWRDPDARLSLRLTTLLFGIGAALQFAVLQWAGERLGLGLEPAAWLQASVALGVVAGAAFAGRHLGLAEARRALPAGIALGLLIVVLSQVGSVGLAWPLLLAIGAAGGLLLVTMNALLQASGARAASTGRAVAVQGFAENLGVLAMLGAWALLAAAPWPAATSMAGLGLAFALAAAGLAWREARAAHSCRKASIGSSRAARRAGK